MKFIILSFILFINQIGLAAMSCDEAIHRGNNIIIQINKWNNGEGQDIPFVALDKMTYECFYHPDWSEVDDNRKRILSIAGNERRHFLNLMRILDQLHVIKKVLDDSSCSSRPEVRELNQNLSNALLNTTEIINEKAIFVIDSLLSKPDPEFAQWSHSNIAATMVGLKLCTLYGNSCPKLEEKILQAKKRQVLWYLSELSQRHNYLMTPLVLSKIIKEAELLGITEFSAEDIAKLWRFKIKVNLKSELRKPSERYDIDWSHNGVMTLDWVTPMSPEDPGFRFTLNPQEINIVDINITGTGGQSCVSTRLANRSFKNLVNLKPDFCAKDKPGMIWAASNLGPHQNFNEDENWIFTDTCPPIDSETTQRIPLSQTLTIPIFMQMSRNPYVYSEEEGKSLVTLLIPLENGKSSLNDFSIGGAFGGEVKSSMSFSLEHLPTAR